jgi:hypothetical protein
VAEDVPNSETPATPAKPVGDAVKPEGDGESRVDPQLIGLAIVLWFLAVGIFVFKWDRLRVDWYLGNIKETGDLTTRLDDASMQALADLAKDDADTLRMIGEEITGPLANRDEFYRSAIVKTIERVEGPAALELILQAADDYHGVVRANAYISLGLRATKYPGERDKALAVLLRAVDGPGDAEPMARAFALSVLGDLGEKKALWPTIKAVREARGAAQVIDARAQALGEEQLRTLGAATFYKLSGTTKEQLPLDPKADLTVRDEQVRAWERWFVSQGNEIPKGESFDEAHPPATTVAPTQGPPAPPSPGSEGGAPEAATPTGSQGSQ